MPGTHRPGFDSLPKVLGPRHGVRKPFGVQKRRYYLIFRVSLQGGAGQKSENISTATKRPFYAGSDTQKLAPINKRRNRTARIGPISVFQSTLLKKLLEGIPCLRPFHYMRAGVSDDSQ